MYEIAKSDFDASSKWRGANHSIKRLLDIVEVIRGYTKWPADKWSLDTIAPGDEAPGFYHDKVTVHDGRASCRVLATMQHGGSIAINIAIGIKDIHDLSVKNPTVWAIAIEGHSSPFELDLERLDEQRLKQISKVISILAEKAAKASAEVAEPDSQS